MGGPTDSMWERNLCGAQSCGFVANLMTWRILLGGLQRLPMPLADTEEGRLLKCRMGEDGLQKAGAMTL